MRRSDGTVTSADGTVIAYECAGSGPALVLVEAAGHFRGFSSFTGLAGLLAGEFTVFQYDRRGRGGSADTQPYAVAREVEDLAALIGRAGGAAALYGYSSGALVALHAAAGGLPVTRLAVLEPPFDDEHGDDGGGSGRAAQAAFTAELAALVAEGRRDAAVERFVTGIGVPDDVVAQLRGTPSWTAMEQVAHTLVYDSIVSEATSKRLLASVRVPALVLHSTGSDERLSTMAAAVAAAMPGGSCRGLPGEWHGVDDEVLAPALAAFLKA